MPWYAIIARDKSDSLAARQKARPAHLERIRELVGNGRVLLAGPHPAIDAPDPGPAGFTGSLIVAEFPSQQEAEDWVNGDPYVTDGVFESYEVKPFIPVLP